MATERRCGYRKLADERDHKEMGSICIIAARDMWYKQREEVI